MCFVGCAVVLCDVVISAVLCCALLCSAVLCCAVRCCALLGAYDVQRAQRKRENSQRVKGEEFVANIKTLPILN